MTMDAAIELPSNGTRNANGNRPHSGNRNGAETNAMSGSELSGSELVESLSTLIDTLRKNLSEEQFAAFVELANDPDAHEDPSQASNQESNPQQDPNFRVRRPAMDAAQRSSFAKQFPDTTRIAMDSYGVQPPQRRAPAMSADASSLFFAMYPDAARG